MASFYYHYQNPSGVCFLFQILGFCYLNLTGITKFKYERKKTNEIILVLVVKHVIAQMAYYYKYYVTILAELSRAKRAAEHHGKKNVVIYPGYH